MTDHDQGPHYIPELDPAHPSHPEGMNTKRIVPIMWAMIALGLACWVGAGAAWYFGLDPLMVPLLIAGAVVLALVFPIMSLFG